MLWQAAELLNCDLNRLRVWARAFAADKTSRYLLIYLLWQSGLLSNHQVGEKLDLTYWAVSRRVGVFKDLLTKKQQVAEEVESR